jgi:hypothetical protein
VSSLGGHNSGHLGHTQHITFGDIALLNQIQRFGLHNNPAFGHSLALGFGFVAYIDHVCPTFFVKMG